MDTDASPAEPACPAPPTAAERMFRFEVERQERRLAERARSLAAARALADRLAVRLREDFGARRVLLFGSIARGDPSDRPDVDLAVEGLDAPRRSEALGVLLSLSDRPVDLVLLERAPPHLRARIAAEGIDLS